MAWSRVRHDHILVVSVIIDDAFDARPGVLNIVEIPPQVAVLDDRREIGLHPRVDLVHRPAARVDHGSSGLVEVEAELGVAPVHVAGVRVTSVQFDVIDVPSGKSFRIQLQVAEHPRISGAGVVAEVLVYSEFQSFGMYLN